MKVLNQSVTFEIKKLLINSNFSPVWRLLTWTQETSYLNADMCQFQSKQKDESRAHSNDSSKAYSKFRAFGFNNMRFSFSDFDLTLVEFVYLVLRDEHWECLIVFSRHYTYGSTYSFGQGCPCGFLFVGIQNAKWSSLETLHYFLGRR